MSMQIPSLLAGSKSWLSRKTPNVRRLWIKLQEAARAVEWQPPGALTSWPSVSKVTSACSETGSPGEHWGPPGNLGDCETFRNTKRKKKKCSLFQNVQVNSYKTLPNVFFSWTSLDETLNSRLPSKVALDHHGTQSVAGPQPPLPGRCLWQATALDKDFIITSQTIFIALSLFLFDSKKKKNQWEKLILCLPYLHQELFNMVINLFFKLPHNPRWGPLLYLCSPVSPVRL